MKPDRNQTKTNGKGRKPNENHTTSSATGQSSPVTKKLLAVERITCNEAALAKHAWDLNRVRMARAADPGRLSEPAVWCGVNADGFTSAKRESVILLTRR